MPIVVRARVKMPSSPIEETTVARLHVTNSSKLVLRYGATYTATEHERRTTDNNTD